MYIIKFIYAVGTAESNLETFCLCLRKELPREKEKKHLSTALPSQYDVDETPNSEP